MKLWLACLISVTLVGCSSERKDDRTVERELQNGSNHYTSANVSGAGARINLEEVKKAFWATQGGDMETAMRAFEKRVNEIYDGKDIVQVDAAQQNGGLLVVGFIDKNGKPGFQSGDDRLFTIEQTAQAHNDQIPYRMSNGDGRPYYEGYQYGGGGGGGFMTGLILGHMLGGMSPWGHYGGHYYTPVYHIHEIHDYRTQYRTTPSYQAQQQQNQSFATRFKNQAPAGGVSSNRKFGDGGFSSQSGTSGRRWGGGPTTGGAAAQAPTTSNGTSSETGTSGWGGRRSTSTSTSTGSTSSGWGGRRSTSGGRRRR